VLGVHDGHADRQLCRRDGRGCRDKPPE
jgi:hypothetical protein